MTMLLDALTALTPGLALALATTFFGIAAYINIAEQPARLSLADRPLLAQSKTSFNVAIALLASIGAW